MTTKALILTLAALAAAPAARAEDAVPESLAGPVPVCDGLGLSEFLTEYYCGQFARIIDEK